MCGCSEIERILITHWVARKESESLLFMSDDTVAIIKSLNAF